jgi:F0F1-type ATP synthase membrane subunit a
MDTVHCDSYINIHHRHEPINFVIDIINNIISKISLALRVWN